MNDDALAAWAYRPPNAAICAALPKQWSATGLTFQLCRRADNETVYDTLIKLTGIGPWTAECYLLFSLRRADIFPSGDLALQHAVRLLYGLDARPDAAALADCASRWAGHRSAAARLLWVYYNGEQAKYR